jgi:hypothetical protein
MNIISIQSAISNFAQATADALSPDPEIKEARLAGLAKLKAEKAAAACQAREEKETRAILRKAHAGQRKKLHLHQKTEYGTLKMSHVLNARLNKEKISKVKDEMREHLRDIRKEKADAAVESFHDWTPSMEDIIPPAAV